MNKSSPAYLKKLEQLFKEAGFALRYEKGNFKAGHCLLLTQQMIIVNKFYTVDTKITALSDIANSLPWEDEQLSPDSKKVLLEIRQTALKL